jgi:hypothetical protein
MKNVSEKRCIEKSKHPFYIQEFFSENRAGHEKMWKKYGRARQATDDDIIRRMPLACWLTTLQTHI